MIDVDSERQNSNFIVKAKMFTFYQMFEQLAIYNVTFDTECEIHCETSLVPIACSISVWMESTTSDINFEFANFLF